MFKFHHLRHILKSKKSYRVRVIKTAQICFPYSNINFVTTKRYKKIKKTSNRKKTRQEQRKRKKEAT